MAAHFDNGAFVHDEDDLGFADGGEAVGYDEAGAVLHEAVHGFLDQVLGTGIDVGGRLVEDHDRWI